MKGGDQCADSMRVSLIKGLRVYDEEEAVFGDGHASLF